MAGRRLVFPDGHIKDFPEGTPADVMRKYARDHFEALDRRPPPSTAEPQLSETPGRMPPGTAPGVMKQHPDAPESGVPGMSKEAQDAQDMLEMGMVTGNPQMLHGADLMLKYDPTMEARRKYFEGAGEDAHQMQQRRAAAIRAMEGMKELERKILAWNKHAPGAFNASIGPFMGADTVGPFGGFNPQRYFGALDRGGQTAHNTWTHDRDKIVSMFRDIPSTNKGGGSDASDANFKEAIGHWIEANNPQEAWSIFQSAKNLIRQKGGLPTGFDLPHERMDPADIASVNVYADPDKQIDPVNSRVARGHIQAFVDPRTNQPTFFERHHGQWLKLKPEHVPEWAYEDAAHEATMTGYAPPPGPETRPSPPPAEAPGAPPATPGTPPPERHGGRSFIGDLTTATALLNPITAPLATTHIVNSVAKRVSDAMPAQASPPAAAPATTAAPAAPEQPWLSIPN